MVNSFGKFCRKLRIDHGEVLFDMATKLGVSSAFLSKVENGKKKPPTEWKSELKSLYGLKQSQVEELEKCFYEAQNYDSIDISDLEDDDRIMMLSFARRFSQIDKEKLKQFLEEETGE